MMKGLVAFWTLFSAISIVVMVLTALAQIHPVPLGERTPPAQRQEVAQVNPEGAARSEKGDRTDSAPEAQESSGEIPARKTGRG